MRIFDKEIILGWMVLLFVLELVPTSQGLRRGHPAPGARQSVATAASSSICRAGDHNFIFQCSSRALSRTSSSSRTSTILIPAKRDRSNKREERERVPYF